MSHHSFHSSQQRSWYLTDESNTLRMGAAIAPALDPGMVVYLLGDLGAGKTTLVRGILRGLGYAGKVKSPTYALVEVYAFPNFNLNLYHFDLYRFNYALEWEESGFGEYCHGQSICLIEWPEQAEGCLPKADLLVALQPVEEGRAVRLSALTEKGELCLQQINFG